MGILSLLARRMLETGYYIFIIYIIYNIYNKYIVNDSPLFFIPFPFHLSAPYSSSLHSTYLSLLHPSPYHLPTPNSKHTKPPMLLCYCVTVLLRYCVQESHVRSFSSSRIYVLGNMYIRLGQHVYTTWTTRIYIIILR